MAMTEATHPGQSTLCYLGLGGNLGQPQLLFDHVVAQFKAHPLCAGVLESPRYCSTPVEATGPDFINSVLQLHWRGSAEELLHTCMAMEQGLGRVRQSGALATERNAPRPIDIDVLLFGQQCMNTATLVVPHPRMHLRRFVLEPLAQLDPQLHIPGQGWVGALLQAVQALNPDAVVNKI